MRVKASAPRRGAPSGDTSLGDVLVLLSLALLLELPALSATRGSPASESSRIALPPWTDVPTALPPAAGFGEESLPPPAPATCSGKRALREPGGRVTTS